MIITRKYRFHTSYLGIFNLTCIFVIQLMKGLTNGMKRKVDAAAPVEAVEVHTRGAGHPIDSIPWLIRSCFMALSSVQRATQSGARLKAS